MHKYFLSSIDDSLMEVFRPKNFFKSYFLSLRSWKDSISSKVSAMRAFSWVCTYPSQQVCEVLVRTLKKFLGTMMLLFCNKYEVIFASLSWVLHSTESQLYQCLTEQGRNLTGSELKTNDRDHQGNEHAPGIHQNKMVFLFSLQSSCCCNWEAISLESESSVLLNVL